MNISLQSLQAIHSRFNLASKSNVDQISKIREEISEVESDIKDPLEYADVIIATMMLAFNNNINVEKAIKDKITILNNRIYTNGVKTK